MAVHFLLLVVLFSLSNADDDICPFGWTPFGTKCYRFISESSNWITAEKYCQTFDGNLASVHSLAEHEFLVSLAPKNTGRTWIGGHDGEQEGQWIWTDGSVYNYKNWCSSQPDNYQNGENCMDLFWVGSPCWNDVSCGYQSPFICAKSI